MVLVAFKINKHIMVKQDYGIHWQKQYVLDDMAWRFFKLLDGLIGSMTNSCSENLRYYPIAFFEL